MYEQIASNKRRTIFLIIIFIALIVAIGYILDALMGLGYSGVIIAVVFSLIMTLVGYYKSDAIALKIAGAVPIDKNDNPYVYRLVENLCITAGLPLPKIYIIPDQTINAFATGRDPEHASVALTQGLINNLENEELEGVIAHELSHIKNYDIRLMTIVVVLVGSVAIIADIASRGFFFSRNNDRQTSPVLMIIGLVLLILSPIIAKLIQLAISRKREYLADASGSLLTRYPQGLANALKKIARQNRPLKKPSAATAHLYIANPFANTKNFISKLFSTHPPIQDRINSLEKMAL